MVNNGYSIIIIISHLYSTFHLSTSGNLQPNHKTIYVNILYAYLATLKFAMCSYLWSHK